jgi:hypothetical protein
MIFFQRKYFQLLSEFYKKTGRDLSYAQTFYRLKNNQKLNLESPEEFTEKIQWLKYNLYTEDYKDFVDKYEVRKYVEKTIGNQYLNELLAVYEDADLIDFDQLPDKFLLQLTHGSGYNVIVEDESDMNSENVKSKLNKYLSMNYFNKYRERIYKNIKPRIIAVKYLEQPEHDYIIDYKFYCIHGKPECVWVKTFDSGKFRNAYYTTSWEKILPDENNSDFLTKDIPKPDTLDKMIELAQKLSTGFIFLRVDLYSIGGKIYFGELTFFPWGGNRRLTVEHLNQDLGKLMLLPISD